MKQAAYDGVLGPAVRRSPQSAAAPGTAFPLGATVLPHGVNFSVFSKDALALDLLLFDAVDDSRPACVVPFDPATNRTNHYWHAFVPGLGAGQIYAYRAYGLMEPSQGLCFDPQRLLLDPYGLAIAIPKGYDRRAITRSGEDAAIALKSLVVDPSQYDWEGDAPLRRPFTHTIVYEMHVRGFTQNPNSHVLPSARGRYAGVIEKIPYLNDLGVTAVELLPVFQFDDQDAPLGLPNYWGYQPISYFVPHAGYSSARSPMAPLHEFRAMVKALHRAGIEVILDVVYNHTAEGNESGPTLCYRGLANDVYYILEADRARYVNHSGCGNTLNANHPVVRRMILDSLRYWVKEMHVDGFRFDLASILARDRAGQLLLDPPALWDIETDPFLAGVKLIAEPWDAGGLYQVGSFIGDRWVEWNGRFRDDVRRFLKGDDGSASCFASRLLGSPDLYGHEDREAEQSINFVTCHDGFTLNDLVSYDRKHNESNRLQNRDGSDQNLSWNCGVEGPTDDPEIERLRNRQVKNFLAATLLSMGTPMILMGDELRRTQLGNNNAYCQDNELSWLDWSLLQRHADIHRFLKLLIEARLNRYSSVDVPELSLKDALRRVRVQWHGVKLNQPDWNDNSHSIALTTFSVVGRYVTHAIVNAYWEPLTFDIPTLDGKRWQPWERWIDTSLESPEDIKEAGARPRLLSLQYSVKPRSVVVLMAAARPRGDATHSRRH